MRHKNLGSLGIDLTPY